MLIEGECACVLWASALYCVLKKIINTTVRSSSCLEIKMASNGGVESNKVAHGFMLELHGQQFDNPN